MADKKLEKEQSTRPPAEQLVLDFLKLHKITLIVDRINFVEENIKDLVYSVNEKMRLRAVYNDQIKKEAKNGNGEKTEKVEVVA